jgi:hypothetical protein
MKLNSLSIEATADSHPAVAVKPCIETYAGKRKTTKTANKKQRRGVAAVASKEKSSLIIRITNQKVILSISTAASKEKSYNSEC